MAADKETNTAIRRRASARHSECSVGLRARVLVDAQSAVGRARGRRLGICWVSEAVRLIHTPHEAFVRFLFLRPRLFLPLGGIDERDAQRFSVSCW